MNNFVFSQDPLLFQSVLSKQTPPYQEGNDLKQQYDAIMNQYHALQQKAIPQPTGKDHLGELDAMTKNVEPDIAEILTKDDEYNKLNIELQFLIQEEMLRNIKWAINNNPEAVSKIDRLKSLIQTAKKEKEEENNRNIMELNDYIKNYSDLTFDEYKQLKKTK